MPLLSLRTTHRLLHHHPLRGLYVLLTALTTLARLPIWTLLYALPATRPVRTWTLSQTLRVRLLRALLECYAALDLRTPLSLDAGAEGERWERVPGVGEGWLRGVLRDERVRPEAVGGTWFPARPGRGAGAGGEGAEGAVKNDDDDDVGAVVLHVHGGAFTIGTGRDAAASSAATALLTHLNPPPSSSSSNPSTYSPRITHVLTLQYRLASRPTHAPFPAALQDTLSAYVHLTQTHAIPAARIVLSGDSAGATLVLGLLRYLAEYGAELDLAPPGAALLWSPWVDVAAGEGALDRGALAGAGGGTDYCGEGFVAWGRGAWLRGLEGTGAQDERLPYASPAGYAFKSPSPLFVQVGAVEALRPSVVRWVGQMREQGTPTIPLSVTPNVPHDILMAGMGLAFKAELADMVAVAGEWLRGVL